MAELGIALAGVLVGALVTEGLRAWHGHVETRRRLRGAKRLVRNELILNATLLTGEQSTAPEIRARIDAGAICIDQWVAHEVLLAESLPNDEWSEVAAVNILFSRLRLDLDLTPDEDLEKIAVQMAEDMERARQRMDPNGLSRSQGGR